MILLDLGLEDFPAFEPMHIIAPIGATFLRQMAAQLKTSSKRPYVESSTSDASQAPPFGDPSIESFVDPTTTVDPPPSTSLTSSMRTMLDMVLTVKATHGQLLLDLLNGVAAVEQIWRMLEVLFHWLHPQMSLDCTLAIRHKKGECIVIGRDEEI